MPVERVVAVPKLNYIDHNIPLDYVIPRTYALVADQPVVKETVIVRPIEYVIPHLRPVPQEQIIEIPMPQANVQMSQRILEKPVTIERVVQVPRAVEQIVEVEVPRKIERASYIEKLVER